MASRPVGRRCGGRRASAVLRDRATAVDTIVQSKNRLTVPSNRADDAIPGVRGATNHKDTRLRARGARGKGEATTICLVTIGGRIEDFLNQVDALRMRRRKNLPESFEKPYWHSDAFAKDLARLEAFGYTVESEADNDAYISSTYPANTGGFFGQTSRTVTRRVPSIHVMYRRVADTDRPGQQP